MKKSGSALSVILKLIFSTAVIAAIYYFFLPPINISGFSKRFKNSAVSPIEILNAFDLPSSP